MRISEGCQLLNLYDEDELVASVNFAVFGRKTAEEIIESLYKSTDLRIVDGSNSISVENGNGRSYASFYWSKSDDWKYGIRTKEEAMELAKEFVRLYKLEHLPDSPIKLVSYRYGLGDVEVMVDGEAIASFGSSYDAQMFVKSKGWLDSINVDEGGLKSHSSAWNRSIILNKDLKHMSPFKWVKALMKYMDDNWERCE